MSIKTSEKKAIYTPLLLAVLAVLIISCSNKNDTPLEKVFIKNYEKTLDSLIPYLMVEYTSPAVGIAIIENGSVQLTKVYGEHQKGRNAPANTIFNIASITKPIVATTVMKLVEDGVWDLDEPIYKYYLDPDIKEDSLAKLITSKHCLSHTAGFKNWRWNEDSGKLKINFKPGTQFQYSGEGMELLRHAIESKFNKSLYKIVDSLLFKPHNMEDATMGWLEDKDTLRFAKWYNSAGNLHNLDYKLSKINAADDMLLSMQDVANFSEALMNDAILEKETFKKMIAPQISINNKLKQGLGWVRYDNIQNLGTIINHDGGDPGVATTLILLPKKKSGIAIFVNSDNGPNVTNAIIDKIMPQGRLIIEGLHWDNDIPKEIDIKQTDLQKYAGTYTTDHGFDITFNVKHDGLMTESDVFPKLKLLPKNKNEFFPLPFEIYFEFMESDKSFNLLDSKREIELTGVKKE